MLQRAHTSAVSGSMPVARTEDDLILEELTPVCLSMALADSEGFLNDQFRERKPTDEAFVFFKSYGRWDLKITRGT
jgi:hypothetical protein